MYTEIIGNHTCDVNVHVKLEKTIHSTVYEPMHAPIIFLRTSYF